MGQRCRLWPQIRWLGLRHKDIAKLLINKGANINQANNNGWTPLLIAAQNGHESTVRCLAKECEADVTFTMQLV
ncbi:MAG: ankyrin repeat domain-containing protein [Alphaproteobacteria bacterium]|nr:ankyrin repeat domain-containing protein [Alphaproteobacteria bacterium]